MRANGRDEKQQREVSIKRNYTMHAEGSVLIKTGKTHVLCNASVEEKIPRFIRNQKQRHGWVTAEYGMLPRSTGRRMNREAYTGKQGGRTLEIQRLIGRSLRAVVDLKKLGEHTITIDCDVLQADGGTRTAAITGAYIALYDAIKYMLKKEMIDENPIVDQVAAISVGIVNDTPILDLDYQEDSNAETDMNIIMNGNCDLIEVQGTAEGKAFSIDELQQMIQLAKEGIQHLLAMQKQSLQPVK